MDDDQSVSHWFWRGTRNLVSIPALILMFAFLGFAGYAKEAGITVGEALFMTLFVWALPAKVILIASATSGAGIVATTVAVGLSSVRLMLMVGSLVPELRGPKTRMVTLLLLSHFIAITAWVITMEKIAAVPRAFRTAYFAGLGLSLTGANFIVVALVFQFSASMPAMALGLLFFITPVYFLASIWSTARDHISKIAIVFGLIAGPFFHWVAPDFALLLAGIVGGTLAFLVGRIMARQVPT